MELVIVGICWNIWADVKAQKKNKVLPVYTRLLYKFKGVNWCFHVPFAAGVPILVVAFCVKMPVWFHTSQWLIMKRQHQSILMDIYFTGSIENSKEGTSDLNKWLQIKLIGADDRSNWTVQEEIVYIRYFAASCICKWNVDYYFFSFPQWTKASMYKVHYTKTFHKYFIMIFSL